MAASSRTTDDSNYLQARVNINRYDLPGLGPVTRGMIQRARQNDSNVNTQGGVNDAAAVVTVSVLVPPSNVSLQVEHQQQQQHKINVVAKTANGNPVNLSVNISSDVEHASSVVLDVNASHQIDVRRGLSVKLVYKQNN